MYVFLVLKKRRKCSQFNKKFQRKENNVFYILKHRDEPNPEIICKAGKLNRKSILYCEIILFYTILRMNSIYN